MGERLRIYIGGLGSNVQEEDLKKTFSSPQLGTVQSVEINRTKGRSFGYLEYVPASDKGLAKLFSTYNGCMWKGGRLKLEKAKEDYLSRLRREWTEEAELKIKSSNQDGDTNESVLVMQKPIKDQDINKLQLKLFFPKLRKIRPIPFKGTGKHKYSFQRVEVPPLPIHFCDCEAHSGSVPPESVKRNITGHHEMDPRVVNEDELNMVKLILNKFLETDDKSKTDYNDAKLTEELNKDTTTYVDNLQADDHDEEEQDTVQVDDDEEEQETVQIDDEEEEQVSDEDNLVINIVGQPNKRGDLFEDWGQKATAASQDSFVREPESFSRPIPKTHGTNKEKVIPDKKRKQSVHDNRSNDVTPSKKKSRMVGLHDNIGNPDTVNTKSYTKQLSSDARKNPRKSAWRDLVIEKKENTTFRISDILAGLDTSIGAEPKSNESNDLEEHSNQDKEQSKLSDIQSTKQIAPDNESDDVEEHSSQDKQSILSDVQSTEQSAPGNESDDQEEHSSQDKEQSKLSDIQSTKQSAPNNKIARGTSWLQKSSWLQLVADANKSAFSISQILPGSTFEKQEVQHGFELKDSKHPVEEIVELRGGKDIYVSPINQNGAAGFEEEKPYSDMKQIEENNEVSAPMHGNTNLWQMNRVVPEIVISDTCPFMKSTASMKEWKKAKDTLSGAQKKIRKGKETAR